MLRNRDGKKRWSASFSARNVVIRRCLSSHRALPSLSNAAIVRDGIWIAPKLDTYVPCVRH